MRSWSKWKIFSRKWKSSSSGRAARADPQRVLVVGDDRALLGGQARPPVAGHLVRLAAVAALDAFLAEADGLARVLVLVSRHLFPLT